MLGICNSPRDAARIVHKQVHKKSLSGIEILCPPPPCLACVEGVKKHSLMNQRPTTLVPPARPSQTPSVSLFVIWEEQRQVMGCARAGAH